MARNDGVDRISARNVNLSGMQKSVTRKDIMSAKKNPTQIRISYRNVPFSISILKHLLTIMKRCSLRWKQIK